LTFPGVNKITIKERTHGKYIIMASSEMLDTIGIHPDYQKQGLPNN